MIPEYVVRDTRTQREFGISPKVMPVRSKPNLLLQVSAQEHTYK